MDTKIDAVVGLEARGFVFGPQVALELQVPFVPVRKLGKLPGKVTKIDYDLEYGKFIFCCSIEIKLNNYFLGKDTMEIQTNILNQEQKFFSWMIYLLLVVSYFIIKSNLEMNFFCILKVH